MSVELGKALQAKLILDQTAGSFYDAVGGRIYQGEAPHVDAESTQMPCLVWNILPIDMERHFGGSITYSAPVQFDLYGEKTGGLTTLGDIETKLFTLLHEFALAPTGFDRGVVMFQSRMGPLIEEDAIRIIDQAVVVGTDF